MNPFVYVVTGSSVTRYSSDHSALASVPVDRLADTLQGAFELAMGNVLERAQELRRQADQVEASGVTIVWR